MKREIKFRVWSGDEMLFLDPYNPPKHGARGSLSDLVEEEHWKVMQFTGLHDKNGVSIYEGDIVTIKSDFKEREWTGKVVWKKCGFSGDGFYFSHYDDPVDLFSEEMDKIEVIGNVYQNPELLKEL